MMVTDLTHLLDLPESAPGPARKLAEHLGAIVQAATAGDAGTAWETAIACPRRPARRACAGRIVVVATGSGQPIRWQCSGCSDLGQISNWEDSPFDLRRPGVRLVSTNAGEFLLSTSAVAALRELALLDPDGQRIVFRARAHPDGAVLAATAEELEELLGWVAAEANHETNRRRQARLDEAHAALDAAACALARTRTGSP